MGSNAMVKIEFLPGTEINDSVREAKRLARIWDVAFVTFKFNGVSFNIGRNADVDAVRGEYLSGANKTEFICAA